MALDQKEMAKRVIRSLAGKSEMELFYICQEVGEVCDDDTGQCTPGTIQKVAIDGYWGGYSTALIDGVNIQSGDAMLLCTFETPINNDSYIEARGGRWTIINPNPIYPADQVQVYRLQLRKS